MRWPLVRLLLALAACGAPAAPPPTSAANHAESLRYALEVELQQLGGAVDPATAVRRSRLLRALGRQAEALAALEAATDGARDRLDWAGLSALWREVGDVHLESGRAQDALDAYGKRLRTAVSLEKQSERALALVDTAYAFALMGAMSRADEALAEAQLLAGSALLQDPEATERIALTRERLADVDRARELLALARRAYEARGDLTGAARTAVLGAQLEARAGRPEALAPLDDVVARARDTDPLVRLSRFRAEAAYRARDFPRCEELAGTAVALADRRGLQHESKIARIALARCAGASDHLDAAIRSAEAAAALTELERQHLTGESARLEIGFEAFQIYRLLLSLQRRLPEPARVRDAFVTMEKARARAHLDAAARTQVTLGGPVAEISPLLLESKAEAEARLRRLTQELAARDSDELRERHKNALWALEDIKEEIAQENPLLARLRLPRAATIAEVQKELLDEQTLLLSYFVGEDHVVAVAVARGEARLKVIATPPDELGAAIADYRWDVLLDARRDQDDVRDAGRDLYAQVLGPFDDLVAAHRRILVIPHGNLSSLPFETLVDRRGKFLVEDHDVSYSLSATLGLELARARGPAARPGRVAFVGVGDPVYDWEAFKSGRKETGAAAESRGVTLWTRARALASSSGRGQRATALERLPGTAKELRAIARLFGKDHKLYLRDDATEENVKSGVLANARIVHVATHGLLEPHYQALALTLDPSSREDGFLLHSEIAELRLDADLVVLSACETGNTQMRSTEPIAGLALALRNAGVRRSVVSLWPVSDEPTARFMTDFYREAAGARADFGAALSEAKRRMLRSAHRHPFYWAPFVLVGD